MLTAAKKKSVCRQRITRHFIMYFSKISMNRYVLKVKVFIDLALSIKLSHNLYAFINIAVSYRHRSDNFIGSYFSR